MKEYIIIDIEAEYAEHFILQENGEFNKGQEYSKESVLKIKTLNDLQLPMNIILDYPKSAEEREASG